MEELESEPSAFAPIGRRGLMRRLYDWVLSWSQSPYGALALVGLAGAEAIFFPVPPDVLLAALVLGNRRRAAYLTLLCTLGSVTGGVVGYLMGAGLWGALAHTFFTWIPGFDQGVFERVQLLYGTYSFWAIFAAGFTPIPFKVFTITAGVFGISMPIFVLAATLSRGLRFALIAALLWRFGEPINRFIDRYFNWLALAALALVVALAFLFNYL